MSPASPGGGESLWLASTQGKTYPALNADLEVDVAVIGGGIAGMTTALALKRDGARVAGIERGAIASGATGFTTAKISALQATKLTEIHKLHGDTGAAAYAPGIPVGLQVGHSAEPLPSDVGRPMLVDDVAIDFPALKINRSHTGWPWTGEFISMLWRHPNVYGDISAYFPKSLDPELVRAMDRQIRHKVMLGTNGFPLERCLEELEELPLRDITKQQITRDNAADFFGL